ncbi:FKBP-type peptidyl-prolyl cis-trans isomerase [Roseateles sp. BYS78W]|uniref:Peptidyl-prolyl cis-trans isomerase n=1 Tax=Pelomonas candidula TaxID=3299025 RepID=A0ABW7H6C6_9BURK
MPATRSRRHALQLAASALLIGLGLTACGGGGSSDSSSGGSTDYSAYGWSNVTALKIVDTTVGTGASATTGSKATVNYTLYLYDVRVSDTKGTKIDAGTGFQFTLGANQVISGFDTGVNGMKVGGSRTVTIPASLAYGSTGQGSVPANAALVFDITLTAVN